MFRNKNEQGLTLIELLITISVLAVVSAIALPVINNVVTSSNSNALQQSIKDAQAFIDRYSKGGVVLYDGLKTLSGYVDSDGDNVIEANEKIDTLTLDDKYSISVTGSAALGGSYTNGGVTAATITSSATGGSQVLTPAVNSATLTYDSTIAASNIGPFGPSAVSATWTTNTPVLVVMQSTVNASWNNTYAFVSVADAAYAIDYYDSAPSGLSVNNNSYTISSAGDLPYMAQTLTHYDADPFTGPANPLTINWTGAAGGGGK